MPSPRLTTGGSHRTLDATNRITKITYPDTTTKTYTYNKLDLAAFKDRQGRVWKYTHDANRRLTATIDPAGQQTQFGYDRDGRLTSLTDPKTYVTSWSYDVQGRLTGKRYVDIRTVTYAYETTTSRLKSITDALSQVKTYSYAKDDLPLGIAYTASVHTTPNVTFAYDPYFPRIVSMTDGAGTTQYAYLPMGTLGGLQLQSEASPLTSSTISYAYDSLGRLSSRTVQGAGAETFGYDLIGRLTTHASDLGSFTLGYLGQTSQITSRTRASSTLATSWSYLTNANDRRLSGISNTGLTAGQFSNYGFTTTTENFISGITESNDFSTVYPGTLAQTATYNNLNQLTNLSGQALTFDAVGNLTSDGQRNYTWDAENRLVGIIYPGVPGKATAFTYDGLSRRVTIASTPAGGGTAVTTSYLWCGSDICQARNASNVTMRSYYDEGEFVPGTPNQPYYYGIDQIASVRRAFASTSSAPGYSYDPYGAPLQVTAPVTDFVYAGMFYNADSGLYLTNYRAYDPVAGRWLSRDRLGERSDPVANLYAYVGGNSLSGIDPNGDNPAFLAAAVAGAAGGFIGNAGAQLINNGGQFSCVDWGSAANAAAWGAIYGVAGEGLIAGIFARAFAALAAGRAGQGLGSIGPAPGTTPKYGATPQGRPLTKHYGTETGPERNIPGSVVDNTINTTKGTPVAGGKTVYYDPVNNITVVTGDNGSIVSVHKGPP